MLAYVIKNNYCINVHYLKNHLTYQIVTKILKEI